MDKMKFEVYSRKTGITFAAFLLHDDAYDFARHINGVSGTSFDVRPAQPLPLALEYCLATAEV